MDRMAFFDSTVRAEDVGHDEEYKVPSYHTLFLCRFARAQQLHKLRCLFLGGRKDFSLCFIFVRDTGFPNSTCFIPTSVFSTIFNAVLLSRVSASPPSFRFLLLVVAAELPLLLPVLSADAFSVAVADSVLLSAAFAITICSCFSHSLTRPFGLDRALLPIPLFRFFSFFLFVFSFRFFFSFFSFSFRFRFFFCSKKRFARFHSLCSKLQLHKIK